MSKLSDLIKIAPQSVMDQYKIKIRDKAIEKVKEQIVKHEKTIDDFSDEQMQAMINEEENRINENVKITILTSLLVAAGIKMSFLANCD